MSKVKVVVVLLILAAVSLSAATVVKARHDYYGICSPLAGVPGFLQRNGFLQTGTCKATLPGQPVCAAGTACTINGNAGTCKNTQTLPGQPISCACVANSTKPAN
jgi:hypothetical protein